MRFAFLLTTLAVTITATGAHAQSAAESRFRVNWDERVITGARSDILAQFRAQVHGFGRQVIASPLVSQPVAPLCMAAASWFNVSSAGLLTGSISLLRPVVFDDGKCSRMTSGGTQIAFNRESFRMGPAKQERSNGGAWFQVPVERIAPDGFSFIDNGDRYEVMTRTDVPLLSAVTAEAWYRREIEELSQHQGEADNEMVATPAFTQASFERWKTEELPKVAAEVRQQMKEAAAYAQTPAQRADLLGSVDGIIQARIEGMQALVAASAAAREGFDEARTAADAMLTRFRTEFAALTPEQRHMPACATPDGHYAPRANCPPDETLWETNPAYFDKTRPAAVQLIVLETPSHAYHGENGAMEENRMAIWRSLDRAALRAMIR